MARPRKPTARKKLDGTLRKDRAPKAEPKYKIKSPTAPKWLGKRARAEWRRLAPLLVAQRLIAETDRATLTAYCLVWEEIEEHAAELRKVGSRYYKAGALIREHPASKALRDAYKRLAALSSQLGLSPADRSRVESLPEPERQDPLAALIEERKKQQEPKPN